MAIKGRYVWRDFVTDGVPASGNNKPKKSEIRQWTDQVDAFVQAGGSGGTAALFTTRDELYADLAYDANSMAWVVADPVAERNGIYRKAGAAGTGSWSRVADLPYSFVVATDTGAGTANAIAAVSDMPLSESALVMMKVLATNTASPVTVAFNGGSDLTIKSNSGNNIAVGGLTANMQVLGIVDGSNFQLVTDQVSSAIVAEAEAAAAAAAASAASINLPDIEEGDAGKILAVNDAETGYDLTATGTGLIVSNGFMFVDPFNLGVLSMELSEIGGSAIFAGPGGNGLFDGFGNLNYVDYGGATNLNTSTVGQLSPSGTPSSPTDVNNGTSDNIGGGDRTYYWLGQALTPGTTITHFISRLRASGYACTLKIGKRVNSTTFTQMYSQAFTSSSTATVAIALTTPFVVPDDGSSYYIGIHIPSGSSVDRIAAILNANQVGNISGTSSGFSEAVTTCPCMGFRYTTLIPGNMSVSSTAITMEEVPEWVQIMAFAKLNGAVVDTNLQFKVSRNSGVNFLTADMSSVFTRPDGCEALNSGIIDIRGEPSGSIGKWRIDTNGGFGPLIRSIGIYFGRFA